MVEKGGRNESDLRYWYVSVEHKAAIRHELAKLGIAESTFLASSHLPRRSRNSLRRARFQPPEGQSGAREAE